MGINSINLKRKRMSNQLISVSSALSRIADGQSLDGYSIDFSHIKIEALDAMQLTKAGIVVPDVAIYYDDDATEFDEDFEGDWKQVPTGTGLEDFVRKEVSIAIDEDMDAWLNSHDIKLAALVENLLNNFYNTQRLVSKGEQ